MGMADSSSAPHPSRVLSRFESGLLPPYPYRLKLENEFAVGGSES
jgi:hypothetical protein